MTDVGMFFVLGDTGHTRSLGTERDSQLTHGDLDHGACVHICIYARTLIIEQLII